MYLADIFYRTVINSGQFLLKTEALELDETKFKILVEDALATYNKYAPIDKMFEMQISSPRTYTFTNTSHPNAIPDVPMGIPEEILAATPVRVYGVNLYFIKQINMQKVQSEYLSERAEVPFRYFKPRLTLPFSGRWAIHAMYHYKITEVTDDETGDINFDIAELTVEQTAFFELLRGKFLQGIGRSRRAFTLNDMPIVMDSAELTSEGQAIEEAAMESLTNAQSKFWLAYGAGR